MEALLDILRSLRISSSIISSGLFRAPWSVSTRGADGAIFHAVIRGRCRVRVGTGGRKVEAGEGDVVLVSAGAPHVTCSALHLTPTPVTDLKADTGAGGVIRVEHGAAEGEETAIICGSFRLDHAAGHRLLELLPELVLIPGGGERARWFGATLDMLASDLGQDPASGSVIITRLAEALVVHLLQTHFLSVTREEAGWVGALRDSQIGQALALIHAEPGTRWSAEELATRVGMSRASFYARFCDLVGEPPVAYLTRWRVSTAADLMRRHPGLSMRRVAGRVGYGTEEGFSRAFRKIIGVTPRQFQMGKGQG